MLPRLHRLTDGQQFASAIRQGRRAGSRSLVVHLGAEAAPGQVPPKAGLVVGKAVGNAVHRNRVKRRLRHLLRDRLPAVPSGAHLVVRALPPAAEATSAQLAAELDRALGRLLAPSRQ